MLGANVAPDQVALARLRRTLVTQFGPIPAMGSHLDLLDARGVTYATQVAPVWTEGPAVMLFGVVRHVVRTQCAGGVPAPDVEGWIAAGRPADPDLGAAWETVALARYDVLPTAHATRRGSLDPQVARLDDVLGRWPGPIATFAAVYGHLERVIETGKITLPPIDA